ncbi:hypothetical protein SAMN04488077_108152 [Roseovarius tolerans]|uniref:Uncharacterized protein n=1 Tax=Roseovarius tolerans TaxID=74031 RepID=A0A1H8BM68_9RHOB|nr:hypothetical protein [Roseovarius tolerans]SEM83589.1 hypothetical protein SAMN04488077_108152 [Roseovarius tolerans]
MIRFLAFAHLAAALGFAASPFLGDGFNGFSPDQFPVPQDDPAVQPAGYAFALWGVIYLWLILGAVFGLIARREDAGWSQVRAPLVASLLVGAAWIPVANASVPWATVMIWAMLATALFALLRAPSRDGWWLSGPVGLYAGWLTAASSVSVGLVLDGYGWLPDVAAAVVALALALVIAAAVLTLRPRALTYAAGVIWALIGVVVQNMGDGSPLTLGLAAGGALLITAKAGYALRRGGSVV